jgi:hypothetical protein
MRTFKLDYYPLVSPRSQVGSIARQRWLRLREEGVNQPLVVNDLCGGRLLVCYHNSTLSDGAAQLESKGLFDEDDIPPVDTWVWIVDDVDEYRTSDGIVWQSPTDYLVAWIPPMLLELANAGIEVSPEQCICWLDTLTIPFAESLRKLRLIT